MLKIQTGRVKKISWGDTTGLSIKAKNKGAVKSFVARHKCKQANDKMTARYWSCRTSKIQSIRRQRRLNGGNSLHRDCKG